MIKLSKMTDYAVIVLADMAQREGRQVNAGVLAESTRLPEPTVSKILKLLVRHRIISSCRGINGGYTLISAPEQITMAQIITAMDGPIVLTACVDHDAGCCERAGNCTMKGKWNPVNQAMQAALENVSLLQMMRQTL